MRYDDNRILQTNSGYESIGFESFNRDDCMCFADACVAKADNSWGFYPQGTSSVAYTDNNGRISTTTAMMSDSIAALDCCTKNIKVSASEVGKALSELSSRIHSYTYSNCRWSDKLNLKNEFRGRRDLRSQLLTI